jgi:hypothetical protein
MYGVMEIWLMLDVSVGLYDYLLGLLRQVDPVGGE